MADIGPGDEVVCVDATQCAVLSEGKHYVVRAAYYRAEHTTSYVALCGLHVGDARPGYNVKRFRKIDYEPEAIEIFRQMTISKKPLVSVDG